VRPRRALALAAAVALAAGVAAAAGAPGPFRPGPKLTGRGEIHRGEFGWSVALSADGTTAAVGASNDDSPTFDSTAGVLSQGLGAVWVFTRSGSAWRSTKLVGHGETGPGQFGDAVALSADGDTLVVGAPADGGGAGAVWTFVRERGAWRQFGAKLAPAPGGSAFGTSIALSGDGRTVLVGGSFAGGGTGAAWVFVRAGAGWKRQAELAGRGESGTGQFGRKVALSADGSTALVGAPSDDGGAGAVWTFARSGTGWQPAGGKLTAGAGVDFGSAVALSADGAHALVGGSLDAGGAGAAWAYDRSGSAWRQDGKLTPAGEVGLGQFGGGVALSGSGDVALVTGAVDHDGLGAAWTFARSASRWTPLGGKLVGRDAKGNPVEFGSSVALSRTGRTALVGGMGDANAVGAAWLFERP
jgi:FG-GAP repeat